MEAPLICLRQISKRFGQLDVLREINLDIHRGEILSIVGPSGAGKTTLLQILGTLLRPTSGSLTIEGQELTTLSERRLTQLRGKRIGFVFQFHQLLPEFTAEENVMLPALIQGQRRRDARDRAQELLGFMGLEARAQHKPSQLSGGEKQRVAVARALINQPAIILADEPTGSLDTAGREELHRLFFRLRDELGQTFVIVTHDDHLSALADRSIQLLDGRIAPPLDGC